jgi:hypothetical protein
MLRSAWSSSFHHGDAALHRLPHFLERAHLDLVDALARYAEFIRQRPGSPVDAATR